MFKKILGWCLFTIGVLIIIWGLFASYKIFTGKSEAPQIISAPESVGEEITNPQTQEEIMQQQIQESIQKSMGGLFSDGGVTKIINLAIWSIFMFIVFMGGGKLSSVGIKLLKT